MISIYEYVYNLLFNMHSLSGSYYNKDNQHAGFAILQRRRDSGAIENYETLHISHRTSMYGKMNDDTHFLTCLCPIKW